MIKFLQIVASIIVLGVAPIVIASEWSGNGFIDKFMEDQSLSIMGTILAIYIAASSSFLAIIIGYEKSLGEIIFNNSSKELRHNVIFVIVIFVVHLFLLSVTPPMEDINAHIQIAIRGAKIFTFLMYIYALLELSNVLFGIRDELNKTSEEK